jgi:hypothetical protein
MKNLAIPALSMFFFFNSPAIDAQTVVNVDNSSCSRFRAHEINQQGGSASAAGTDYLWRAPVGGDFTLTLDIKENSCPPENAFPYTLTAETLKNVNREPSFYIQIFRNDTLVAARDLCSVMRYPLGQRRPHVVSAHKHVFLPISVIENDLLKIELIDYYYTKYDLKVGTIKQCTKPALKMPGRVELYQR